MNALLFPLSLQLFRQVMVSLLLIYSKTLCVGQTVFGMTVQIRSTFYHQIPKAPSN